MKTIIDRFGFEIEGEFSNGFSDDIRANNLGVMKGDGSVHACGSYDSGTTGYDKEAHGRASLSSGEFNSRPFYFGRMGEMEEAKKVLDTFKAAAKAKRYHWNISAGMHVHVSFHPIKPPELYSLEFSQYFEKLLKQNFPVEYKLRKGNRFCGVIQDEQQIAKPRDRYRFINYTQSNHKTIEFRFFPANEPEKMWGYLQFTLNAISEFLLLGLEKKIVEEIELGDTIGDAEVANDTMRVKGRVRKYYKEEIPKLEIEYTL